MEEIQLHLASQVQTTSSLDVSRVSHVAGLDIQWLNEKTAIVSASICTFPRGKEVWSKTFLYPSKPLEYKAGYLGFREVPLYRYMWSFLKRNVHRSLHPQVVLIDGNGILHPRLCGSASHFGVLETIPTIGVAKNIHMIDGLSRDIKQWMATRGLTTYPLKGVSGIFYGYAFRSPKTINPIYISPGHKISQVDALTIVSSLCHYREPEPLRLADRNARAFERSLKSSAQPKVVQRQPSRRTAISRLRNKTEFCTKCFRAFCPHRNFPYYVLKEDERIPLRFYCPQCVFPLERRSTRLDDEAQALLLTL